MATTYKIFNYRTFDFNTLKYSKPQKSKGNAYICPVVSDYDILFQTSVLVLAKDFSPKDNYLSILVDKNNDFFDFYKKLDEYVINYLYDNCSKWLDEQLEMDAVREFYKSNITTTEKGEELHLNLDVKKGSIQINIYDQQKNKLDDETLKEGTKLVLCFRNNGIKFLKKHCFFDSDICQIQLQIEPKEPKDTKESKEQVKEAEDQPEETPTEHNSEILKRMLAKNKINELQTKLTEAINNADKAQLYATQLKNTASLLASELKKLQDDYERDDESESDLEEDEEELE
jgi:hypothetical protein